MSSVHESEYKLPHDGKLKWGIDVAATLGLCTYDVKIARDQIKNYGGMLAEKSLDSKALSSVVGAKLSSNFLWGGIAGNLLEPAQALTRKVLGKDASNAAVATGGGMLSSAAATALLRPLSVITLNSQTQSTSILQSAKELAGGNPLHLIKESFGSLAVASQVTGSTIFGATFWGASSYLYDQSMKIMKSSNTGLSEENQKIICGTGSVVGGGTGAMILSTPFSLYAREKAYDTARIAAEKEPKELAAKIMKPLEIRIAEAFKGNFKRFIIPMTAYGLAASYFGAVQNDEKPPAKKTELAEYVDYENTVLEQNGEIIFDAS